MLLHNSYADDTVSCVSKLADQCTQVAFGLIDVPAAAALVLGKENMAKCYGKEGLSTAWRISFRAFSMQASTTQNLNA